ncbi:MAG: Lon protease family protein [Candidatus Kapaibacterium sp.]
MPTNKDRKPGPRKLALKELRWSCPVSKFKFKTTDNLKPLDNIVGQPRAVEAIRMGAQLDAKGYNIFVTGLSGTGRLTTVKKLLEDITHYCPLTNDYCYVNNFKNPDNPCLIKMPRGQGKKFSIAMDDIISFLKRRLPKLFEEESHQSSRRNLIEEYQHKERKMLEKFDKKIKPMGFVRGQVESDQGQVQPDVFPLIDDKPVHIDGLNELVEEGKLSPEKASEFKQKHRELKAEIFELVRSGMKIMKEFRKALMEHDKAAASIEVTSAFEDLKEFGFDDKIKNYIEEVKKHILNNLNLFVSNEASVPQLADSREEKKNGAMFNVYKVNVVLDNSLTENVPMVIETTPSYNNLFGTVEKEFDSRGFWRTDFTMIKGGAILRADRGFLIVNAQDLFSEPGVWPALKRVLLYNKLELQPFDSFFQISQSHLKPEPIEVKVKVIIIGGGTLYRALYHYEKGFKKIFKVNAQFDYETSLDDDMMQNYARFIKKITAEENLPGCSPDGVAAIVEWAVEKAGSQGRISLKFSDVADILREAAFYDRKSSVKYITRAEVEKACEQRKYRNNLIDEKIKRHILEGSTFISTEGERIGQINGLTVYNNGLMSFGKPARITATVSAGNAGIVNIDRESDMSGRIHNKGVLIITGFIREKFAIRRPLSLTASVAFEQTYGGIDGDSASAAEIYVILSAIAEIPIRQSWAITGSVNQKGDIQPIGGVNEKIRGFYEICKDRGFTGNQGIIIPEQNVKDLMLDNEIIEDVKAGNFSIISIHNIDDAIKPLMNIEAGKLNNKGKYPPKSLYGRVVAKLEVFYKYAKEDKEKKKIGER